MKAAVLAIGTELTRGELCDSNTHWLSEQLTALGVEVVEHVSVDDDDTRIVASLRRLGGEVGLLVVTGGLGPTSDDRTAAAAATALGVSLVRDTASLEVIKARYSSFGRVMPASNSKQADFPEGATPLANGEGTAPGFQVRMLGAEAFFTPGVPREMRHLYGRHIVPFLVDRVERRAEQIHLRTFGVTESAAAERLSDIEVGGELSDERVSLGYRAGFPEVEVKILAEAKDLATARELAERYGKLARERLAPFVFGGREGNFPTSVGKTLRLAGVRVAAAESCTGGLIGKLLTDLPGSSEYFVGSAVTYYNEAKTELLGVDPSLLERDGAVSSAVVKAMADGVRSRLDVDFAVAVSGIAGPGGGSGDKPVGTVWFGVAGRGTETISVHRHFPWDRERVRLFSAYFALLLLRDAVLGAVVAPDLCRPNTD